MNMLHTFNIIESMLAENYSLRRKFINAEAFKFDEKNF